MRASIAKAFVAVAIVLTTSGTASVAAESASDAFVAVSGENGLALSQQPTSRELLAKASEFGTVSVVVELSSPPSDDDRLSPAAAQAQASEIARVQDKLLARLNGGRSVKRFSTMPGLALEVTRAELARLLADPAVAHIYEDVSLEPLLGDSTRIIGAKRLADVWGVTGVGQRVAVLDTGVNKSHPMLQNKVVREACFSTTRGGASPTESFCPSGDAQSFAVGAGVNCPANIFNCHHGTHVASIAVGKSANLSGVAPGAKIIAVKVASKHLKAGCSPLPCAASLLSDVINALEWIYDQRAVLKPAAINMSIGGALFDAPCDTFSGVFTQAVSKLRTAGIPVIVGSGNEGKRGIVRFPACVSKVIAVGATDKNDAIWGSSNHSGLVKLLAPGVNIKAAVPAGYTKCPVLPGSYCLQSGTSQAAPHVAGAWALLKSAGLTPQPSLPAILAALNCTGYTVSGNTAFQPRRRIGLFGAYTMLREPEGDENHEFNAAGSGSPWRRDLEEWTAGASTLRTSTSTWATNNIWAMASLPYCSSAFEVDVRLWQRDPTEPPGNRRWPLETGIMLASHITEVFGIPQADGYYFTISRPDDGSDGSIVTVKRMDNKSFDQFQIGTEVTKCRTQRNLSRNDPHVFTAEVFGNNYAFSLDGTELCSFTEFRYAPPSRIGLVARREGPGGPPDGYWFVVDYVRIRDF